MVKVLIAGQAANCRRVETQSGSSAHLAVDDRRQHFALESAERGRLAKVKVVVKGSRRSCDSEIDRQNLKHAGHDAAILTANPSEE